MPLNPHNAEYHMNRLPDRIHRLRQWLRVRSDLNDYMNRLDDLEQDVQYLLQEVNRLKSIIRKENR